MAYIRKRGRRWLAEICRTALDGALVREACSHDTKAEAMAWAVSDEQRHPFLGCPLVVGQLLDVYLDIVDVGP